LGDAESIAKDVLTIIAVLVFLAFVGMNVYRSLYPPRMDVECVVKDSRGRVISTVRAYPTVDRLERFLTEAQKRGETCRTIPSARR
jgi:hypothetical protein